MDIGDKFTKDGVVYVVTLIESSKTEMHVYMRSEEDLLEEFEKLNLVPEKPITAKPTEALVYKLAPLKG